MENAINAATKSLLVPVSFPPHLATTLRMMAADADLREMFRHEERFRRCLWPAARRFIVASDARSAFSRAMALASLGYRTGLEYADEDVLSATDARRAQTQYMELLEMFRSSEAIANFQIGFDLSALGLHVSDDLAEGLVREILQEARRIEVSVVLSMERSELVPRILRVFRHLAESGEEVGITLQAHLHRTEQDISLVSDLAGKVRLVKGVYLEPPSVALPRGPELDTRYVRLAEYLLAKGISFSCASHDSSILDQVVQAVASSSRGEIEMLHGVRADELSRMAEQGAPCRVSAVYGDNWWLHVLHRVAEFTGNAKVAIDDLADPERTAHAVKYRPVAIGPVSR